MCLQSAPITEKPLVATMGVCEEKTLVETAFVLVQKGRVLSYQQPIMPTKSVNMHQDCPSYPPLPLGEYRLDPTKCMHVCTEEEHFHIKSLMITLNMAYKIEAATQESKQQNRSGISYVGLLPSPRGWTSFILMCICQST